MTHPLGYIAYSLRFDNEHTCTLDEDYSQFFNKFLNDNFKKWLFALENKKDGTPHFQGIVWCEEKLEKKRYNRLRAQIRLKLVGPAYEGKGSYAFTISTKPTSLAKYCNDKEGTGVYTNLTEEEREDIGEWVEKDVKKQSKKQTWLQLLDEINDPQTAAGMVAKAQTTIEWAHSVIELYSGVYGNLPRHTQVENWVYQYKATVGQRTSIRTRKYSQIFSTLYEWAADQYDPPIN